MREKWGGIVRERGRARERDAETEHVLNYLQSPVNEKQEVGSGRPDIVLAENTIKLEGYISKPFQNLSKSQRDESHRHIQRLIDFWLGK